MSICGKFQVLPKNPKSTIFTIDNLFQDDDNPDNTKFDGFSFEKKSPENIMNKDNQWLRPEEHQIIFDVLKNQVFIEQLILSPSNLHNLNDIMDNIEELFLK